jgi:hypothetical protein
VEHGHARRLQHDSRADGARLEDALEHRHPVTGAREEEGGRAAGGEIQRLEPRVELLQFLPDGRKGVQRDRLALVIDQRDGKLTVFRRR